MTTNQQANTTNNNSSTTAGNPIASLGSSLFSTEEYVRGDVTIQKKILDELNKILLKAAGYAFTTILGVVVAVVWSMRAELSEVQGKISAPDKYLDVLNSRVNKLENDNKELQTLNYKLEIKKLKLESQLKK